MDCSIQNAKLLHLIKCLRWNTLWCFSKCLWLICQSVYLCSKCCMPTSELTWSHFLVKIPRSFLVVLGKIILSSTSKSCFHLYLLNIENINVGLWFSNSNWRKVLWHWRFELVCAVQVWHPVQPPPCSAAPAHPTLITVGAHLSPQDMRRLIAAGALVLVQKTASLWRSHLTKVSWLHDLNVWRCPSGVSSWHQWKREIWVVLFLKTVLKQAARNIMHITGIVFNIHRSNQPKVKQESRMQTAKIDHIQVRSAVKKVHNSARNIWTAKYSSNVTWLNAWLWHHGCYSPATTAFPQRLSTEHWTFLMHVDFFRAWCWFGDWSLLSDPGELCSWHLHP